MFLFLWDSVSVNTRSFLVVVNLTTTTTPYHIRWVKKIHSQSVGVGGPCGATSFATFLELQFPSSLPLPWVCFSVIVFGCDTGSDFIQQALKPICS